MTATKTIVAPLALLLCGACASTAPLTPESGRTLSGAALVGQHGETPAFIAGTPGKAAFGLIGHSLMVSKGREVVRENGVEDPAPLLVEALVGDLVARHGARAVGVDTEADFALDVTTTGWQYFYYLASDAPLPYRVRYAAKATLTDLGSGAVIAQGDCDGDPGERSTAPTLEELLADGAARLKSELRDAADLCLGELRSSVFGIANGPS